MKLGVKRGSVKIVADSTSWQTDYEKEKILLLEIFKDNRVEYSKNKTEFIQKVLKHE